MFRALYDEIKRIFVGTVSTDELRNGFVEFSIEQKIQLVMELLAANQNPYVKKAGEYEAKCFLVILHLALKLLAPNSKELYDFKELLGIPTIQKWPKPNPPQTEFGLFNESGWGEETNKMAEAAKLLAFDSVHNYEDIVVAVKTALGIGGMEDLGDSRAISNTDVTLKLGVEYALYSLKNIRPDWHGKDGKLLTELPSGGDPRPKYVIDIEALMEIENRRGEVKRANEEERRNKKQGEYAAKRKGVFDALEKVDTKAYVEGLCQIDYPELKKLVKGNKDKATWLSDEFVTSVSDHIPMEAVPEDKDAAAALIVEKMHFIEQFVLSKVLAATPEHYTWFKDLANGDLTVRRGIGTDGKGTETVVRLTKAQRTSRGQLNKLFEKYGVAELAAAVLAVFGIVKPVEEVFGPLPEKSAVVFAKTE